MSASFGLAEIDASVDSSAAALKIADDACYAAKREGRNQVVLRQPGSQPGWRRSWAIVDHLFGRLATTGGRTARESRQGNRWMNQMNDDDRWAEGAKDDALPLGDMCRELDE